MECFQRIVTGWYLEQGRNFYWRKNRLCDWNWFLLEMLLRKTKAETVEKFFTTFIEKYTTPYMVVNVCDEELENDLRFLGLYRQRRKAIKEVATILVKDYNGVLPTDSDTLSKFPNVGPYIMNAFLCFCRGLRKPIVDINVMRVITRVHGLATPKSAQVKWIWQLAENILPEEKWIEYNYGLLDIGALYCKNLKPKCEECAVNSVCANCNKII